MNDAAADKAAPGTLTAGRLLREARQAQGLHIVALASAIKVAPRKLELLESDRFDELPDATFTRALAQTVCRSLKVDSAPVLALLPPPNGNRLEQFSEGLNTPFRERPGRLVPSDWSNLASPAIWGPALVLVAAAAVYLLPAGLLPMASTGFKAASPVASAAAGIASMASPTEAASNAALTASEPVVSPASALPSATSASDAASSAATQAPATAVVDVPAKLLQLHSSADSWIEVVDVHGKSLLSRVVAPGESVDLNGELPLKVTIGNASATDVIFRGQALELAPFSRDNLARLELK